MKRNLIIIFLTMLLLLNPVTTFAQNSHSLKLSAQMTQEYSSNFIRMPDSLKISDYRTNLFLNVGLHKPILHNGRLEFYYELRYNHYHEYQNYNRQDHLADLKFQKPIFRDIKLHFSDEFRARFSATRQFSYYRNIFNLFLNVPITTQNRAYIGFQNWTKNYPGTTQLQGYQSSRLYSKVNLMLTPTTTFGLKFEYQFHGGDLYPGSSVDSLSRDLDGRRYVFLASIDKMLWTKLFANISYRFENDLPSNGEINQTGEHIGDENNEDWLAEDSDFGYLKNQFSFSALMKLNARISVMAFYLVYNKNFQYWYVTTGGAKRFDRLFFISHILKINLYKGTALLLQHNFENNYTNLKSYRYRMNSFSAGLSVQF